MTTPARVPLPQPAAAPTAVRRQSEHVQARQRRFCQAQPPRAHPAGARNTGARIPPLRSNILRPRRLFTADGPRPALSDPGLQQALVLARILGFHLFLRGCSDRCLVWITIERPAGATAYATVVIVILSVFVSAIAVRTVAAVARGSCFLHRHRRSPPSLGFGPPHLLPSCRDYRRVPNRECAGLRRGSRP
jgi:hypothetical protein